MNGKLADGEISPDGQPQKAPISLKNIMNLLRTAQQETNHATEFSQDFVFNTAKLGDRLFEYIIPDSADNSVHSEQNQPGLYLVYRGRIRLIGFDQQKQREVSTVVLEAGETFGADDLLCPSSLPYRAIAASQAEIAWLPKDKLIKWLEKLTNLRIYLQQQTVKRQCLVFLKTCTELKDLSSHNLKPLLSYLVETQIKAGEKLAAATPASTGRFWLRSGIINKPESHINSDSKIGESWGYPNLTPTDWTAETDLLIYKLPLEDWEAAAPIIVPVLAVISSESASKNIIMPSNGQRQLIGGRTVLGFQTNRLITPSQNDQESAPKPVKKSEPINFPKPIQRRILDFLDRFPFIQQQSSSDCGAACLAMISLYWGKRFSLNFLREVAEVGREGASLKSLAKASETLGFQARPVRASLNKLAPNHKPWIAHWQGIHYIVVYRVKSNTVIIADPAAGKRAISHTEFVANWTGYALLLDPTHRLQNAETQKISLGQFWRALLPYRSLIGQIIAASLLIQIFGVISPLFTQIILDQVVVNKSLVTLNVFAIGLVIFGLWSTALTATRQYLLDYFSNRFDLTLITGFISHTLVLPLKFFESRRVGDIITRVQENQKIQQFLTRQVILAWLDMLTATVYLGLMLHYNWRLTLLVLALIPPIVILTLIATPFLRSLSREIFNEAADQNSLLVEMLTGVATVKAAAAEREIRWRWEDRFTSFLNVGFRGQKLRNILQVAGSSINLLGSTALLWYGATLVIQDQLTIGQFVAFNMMIGKVISPVLTVVNLWDEMQEVLISVERLNDVFEAQPEESPGKPMLILPRLRGDVRFENVSFRYDSNQERNTLQNITFEAHSGETIAIVGRSGSGKSTLVNLIQALYHPEHGRILFDGHDIRHVSPQSLRTQLGVVPQECFLFSGTIIENITLYRSEFSLEQVTEVAKLAEAHTFIQDLALGYNTKVGERGSSLSGGQRQRIAIARALLGSPRILVLDEATSSLDTESERRFQQNLERLARDRTTFIIAHRLSTVRNAHCILVLDRGVLIERGTHSELMELHGVYYHLAQQQLDL